MLVGTVALYVLILTYGKEATIWDLAIKEKYRRMVIATKLMNKVEGISRKLWYDDYKDKRFVKNL